MGTLAARDYRRAKRLPDLLDSISTEVPRRLDELRPLFANTNGFNMPKRHSPTGRRRAANAPAEPQRAAALKRVRAVAGGAVPGGRVRPALELVGRA